MHQELNPPDSAGCGVGAGRNGPGWELLGEGAHRGPFPSAGEGDGLCGGGTEGIELGRG